LFNLPVSGPPALFFVYHVYPVVALFGPAAWATAAGAYTGLDGSGRYDSFVNTVTAGFVRGGLGQWTWAGGVEIERAEEYQRWVLHRGTLRRQDGRWEVSTRNGASPLELEPGDSTPAAQQFLAAVRAGSADWRSGVRTAFEAARLGLAAETAMSELRRVDLPPCT
jgi:hypothetical protein